MKTKITTLFIILCTLSIFAQHNINGKIVDAQNTPLPFANIVLQKIDAEAKPKGTVSDENGTFFFDKIASGKYKIEISMLGFKTYKISELDLNTNKTFNITLQEETQTLNEVVVKSKRPVIKQTAEKLIVDLEKSEMINTNLQDVMRKIPGVLVTNNGISIAGNRGVRILINGKTTEYMDVETLLRDFPADNIAKVEVVEQPGAEYEASGSGAIINIILKKNVKLGTYGSVNSWVGEDQGFEWGSGFSIASYKNKLNWQLSTGYSQPTWREDLFLIRTVGEETYNQVTREPYDPDNFRFGGSLDYYISDKHSIGIGGQINTRDSDRIASSKTIISDENSTNTLFSENSFNRQRTTFNINPYYEYKTNTDKLLIDFNYIDFVNDNTNILSDAAGSTIDFTNRKYIQDGTYNIKTYRIDYTKTFSDNFKLSAGSRFADVATDNDLQAFSETNNIFEKDIAESSRFVIDETILAFYGKINAKMGKWSFSGGLRYEDSNTNGTSTFIKDGNQVTEIQKRPIQKIFPSASISRKLTNVLGASVSYSYRIQRPSYSSLNSFQQFLDPFSANEGNPTLRPSFTNNYQFNLTYDGQPFFTIGYSKTDDAISQVISQTNSTAQIRQQETNIDALYNWNFRLFAPVNFAKGLDGFTGIIVNNNNFAATILDDDNIGESFKIDLSKWNLIWFIQASYQLPWDINLEVSGNYGTGALEGQIEVDWLAELDFSFGKKFLDDKLKVNLGFNKMLNRGFVGNIDYGNGTAWVESNGSRQNVQLRLVYSFGSKFGKKKSRRNTNRDEQNRINDSN
ncbi:TonB-dependent receptor [Polaribacter sp. M15]